MTVLVKHDTGCKWGRFDGTVDPQANILSGEVKPGHSDAAKRFSDLYNLHKAAGTGRGWIAVKYLDGSAKPAVYETRAEAVSDCWPWEDQYFYATLSEPSLTICAAESLLRYKRVMSEIDRGHTDRDAPHGGLEVIPRLAVEDQESQIRAVRSGKGMIAMGHKRGKRA